MKRQGWIRFLIGILFCLLMVMPPVVQASLDVDGDFSGTLLLNAENQSGGTYWDGTSNTDAYIRPNVDGDGLAVNTNGWRIFNDGGEVYNSSLSGLIFGYPYNLMSGSLYNNSGYIEGSNGVKMGAGTVTNSGGIFGYNGNGIYQYSEGASTFTVNNGVYIPLTVIIDPDTGAMTITPGAPQVTGIGMIVGGYGGIYSHIGGAGTATVDNAGLIIGYGGAGIVLEGNGTSTATVTNTGSIYGGYGGYYYDGVDIGGVLTATVTNSGLIAGNQDGIDIEFANTATVTNNTNGGIYGYDDSGVYMYGVGSATVTNSGRIEGEDYGIYIEGDDDDDDYTDTVTITNNASGRIYSEYYDAIYIDDVGSATVTNSGIIEAGYNDDDDDSHGIEIEYTDTATVTNNTGGRITGYDYDYGDGIHIYDVDSVTVTNSGIIEGYDGIYIDNDDDDDYTGTVTVTNNAGGKIYGYDEEGIDIYDVDSATITNSGLIEADNHGIDVEDANTATVTNNAGGKIYAHYDHGVEFENVGSVTVTNSGEIIGGYGGYDDDDDDVSGIYINGGSDDDDYTATVTVTNNAGGIIAGSRNGVDIEYVGTATVNNAGTIIGYGGYGYNGSNGDSYGYGYGYGGDIGYGGFGAYGVLAYQVDGVASITNSGTITGYAADGYGGNGGTGDDYYYGSSGSGGYGGMGMGAWLGLGISVSGADSAYVENSGIATGYGGSGIGGDGGSWIGDYNGYSGNGGNGGMGMGGFIGGMGIGITQVTGLAEVVNSGTVTGYGGNGIGGDGGNADYDYSGVGGSGGDGMGGNGFGVSIVDIGSAKVTNSSALTINGIGGTGIGGDGGQGYYNYSYNQGNGGTGYGANGYGVFITNWMMPAGFGEPSDDEDDVTPIATATVINDGGVINGTGGNGYGGDGYFGGSGIGGDGYGVNISNAKIVAVGNSGVINGTGGDGYGGYGGYISDSGYGYGGSGYGVYVTDAETSVTVININGTISGQSGKYNLGGYGGVLLPFTASLDDDDDSVGVYIEHTPAATVFNVGGTISGTSEVQGYQAYSEAGGVYIDSLWDSATDTAGISNSGTISGSATSYGYGGSGYDPYAYADAYGAYIDDADTVTVTNGVLVGDEIVGGTISATALGQSDGNYADAYSSGVYIEDAPTAVTVVNYGDITASSTALADMPYGSETVPDYDDEGYAYSDADGVVIEHTAAATVTNVGGTISAMSEARGYGGSSDAYGVNIDSLWDSTTDTALINNSGTISASASAYSYGYGGLPPKFSDDEDDDDDSNAYGVYIDDADTVTVNNYMATVEGETTTITGGTISATAFTQTDGGFADAYAAGVYVEDAPTAVTVTNYGDITASGTALADMPYGSETVPDYDDEGYAYGNADGVYIEHTAAVTVNNVGGTISATGEALGYGASSGAFGVYIDSLWDESDDTVVINNSGTISASASAYNYGYGGYVEQGVGAGGFDPGPFFGYGGAFTSGVYVDDADTVTVNNYIATVEGETTTITGGTISGTAFAQTDGYITPAFGAGLFIDQAYTSATVISYGTISGSATALSDMPYGSETVPDYDEGFALAFAGGLGIEHSALTTVTNVDGTISGTSLAKGYDAESEAYGVYIDALWDDSDDSAIINNSGSITASATAYIYGYDGYRGVGAGGFDQPSFGYGGAFATGVYIDDADTVTVNNYVATVEEEKTTITGGTISGTAFTQSDGGTANAYGAGLYVEDAATKVTVTSYGDITGNATALGDMPYGSQTAPDYDEGNAYAYADGIVIEHTAEATVNNVGGTISGTGTATGYYGIGYGGGVWIDSLWNESGDTATVNNSGTISGSGTGNSYGGEAYGYGGGVYIDDAETATVFNGAIIDEEKNLIITGGTISGTGTGNGFNQNNGFGYGYGVYVEDAYSATVTNYGTISGTGTGSSDGFAGYGYGYGVYMNNIYGNATAIVTNIGGTISGKGTGLSEDEGYGDGYGYGVYMSNVDSAIVTNGAIDEEVITGGTISGEGVSYNDGSGYGYGVYINNANDATVTNYGTVTATGSGYGASYGIYLGHYVTEGDVYNYGTITATGGYGGENFAIYVDGPAKNVTLGTGSVITGLVYSEDEENNIILEAADATDFNEINANQIDGFSSMEKTGSGTWVLNGDKDFTQYSEEGTLYDRNMPITVTEGVLAFGKRATTPGVITNSLTVDPAASIGYVIAPSATETAPTDASGALTVTGDADFGGSTVIVIPTPIDANRYLLTTRYENVLTVGGTLTLWGDVTANSAFLTPYLVADNGGLPGVYDLILQRLSFTTGADPSSIPLGEVLDELYGSTDDPDLLALLNALLTDVSEGEAAQALAELGGGSHTAFQLMSFDALDKYLGILNNHMGGMGGFGGLANYNSGNAFAVADSSPKLAMTGSGDTISDVAPILMAAVGNVISQGQAAKGTNWGLWADGYLGTGNRRSDELIAKYKQNLFGGIIGFDYRVAGDLFIGIAGGISRTNVEFDDLLDNGHMDSYHGSLYLCYNGKPWYAAGVFTYAYNKYNLDRYITAIGPTQVANSDYSGNEYTGYAEVGYKISAGNVEIRPLAAFQVDYLEQEAFTETGAGIYNLNVDKRDTGSYKSFLGVNVTGNIKLGENAAFKPEFRLKWSHEFSNDDHMINAQFEGMGSSYFSVAAEQLSRDTAIIGVGMNLLFNKHVAAYIQYDAELNSDFVNHTGLLGLRLAW